MEKVTRGLYIPWAQEEEEEEGSVDVTVRVRVAAGGWW